MFRIFQPEQELGVTPSGKAPMPTIILFTVVAWFVVNIFLMYSLTKVHGWDGIPKLWGYTPNQFLFLLVVFPFAAFSTFTALHELFSHVGHLLPDTYKGKILFDNWVVVLLLSLSFASVVGCLDFIHSAKSLDKLKPVYAKKALLSIASIDKQILELAEDKGEKPHER